jgi:hypothetical protein
VPDGTYDLFPRRSRANGADQVRVARHAYSWWLIGHQPHRNFNLHAGRFSEGCATVTELNNWEAFYQALTFGRSKGDSCAGVIVVRRAGAGGAVGRVVNRTPTQLAVYGPPAVGSTTDNQLYRLSSGHRTPTGFRCDGLFVPAGRRVGQPFTGFADGPVAVRVEAGRTADVRADGTDLLLPAHDGLFRPSEAGAPTQFPRRVNWPIPPALDQAGIGALPVVPGEEPVVPTPQPGPPRAIPEYGNYDLRLGDRDDTHTFDGQPRQAPEPLPGPSDRAYVDQLQTDLKELGFALVGTPDGVFGRHTEWAVREFQIYAGMEHVAQETTPGPGVPVGYLDRLSRVPVPPADRYTGPITGVANAATRAAILRWLAARWRCPLVVRAHVVVGGGPGAVAHENVWLPADVPTSAFRVYARDFSRYYTLPAGTDPDALVVLSDRVTYLHWAGPRAVPPNHTWASAELLPEHLTGTPLAGLSAAARSTFKVVRAVSEVECLGYFDAVNAYDNAFVSLGPCHWTWPIANTAGATTTDPGELPAYLAYLREVDTAAYQSAVGRFGPTPSKVWGGTGAALFDTGSRKYQARVALPAEGGGTTVPTAEADLDYFRTWHWFYRFQMAGRTIGGFRRRMWHMARVRVRDILAVPMDLVAPGRTIGQVFTSELAVALLTRWHVRFPGYIIANGQAGSRVRAALTQAQASTPPLDWSGAPVGWGEAHEARLIAALRAIGGNEGGGLPTTLEQIVSWPAWAAGGTANPRRYALDPNIGQLSRGRGSFQVDTSDLPPSPV